MLEQHSDSVPHILPKCFHGLPPPRIEEMCMFPKITSSLFQVLCQTPSAENLFKSGALGFPGSRRPPAGRSVPESTDPIIEQAAQKFRRAPQLRSFPALAKLCLFASFVGV
jgi:hypothetical protein